MCRIFSLILDVVWYTSHIASDTHWKSLWTRDDWFSNFWGYTMTSFSFWRAFLGNYIILSWLTASKEDNMVDKIERYICWTFIIWSFYSPLWFFLLQVFAESDASYVPGHWGHVDQRVPHGHVHNSCHGPTAQHNLFGRKSHFWQWRHLW